MNRRRFVAGATMTIAGASGATRAATAAADPVSAAGGAWRTAAALPYATQELYPAVHASRLYVAGGIAARLGIPYFTDRCVSFASDASDSGVWRIEPELPESLHHAALVGTPAGVVLVGGFNGGYTHIWRMRDACFVLREGAWQALPSLPQPQAEGVLAMAPDGRVHLATGQSPRGEANSARSDHREVTDHWVLVPGAPAWERAAPIPTPRNSATGSFVGDTLVVTGGRTASGNLDATELYDAREDRWRTATPMPQPQAGTASAVVDAALYVFGGEIFRPRPGVFAESWRYESAADQWQPLPDLPTPRHGLGAGVLGDEVFVVGGATQPSGRGTSSLNQALRIDRG